LWSKETGLPIPPMNAVPDPTVVHWVTVIYITLVAIGLIYALAHIRQQKGRLMLLIMAGGAISILCEPLLDLLGAAWYPTIGIPVAFEMLARPMPVWLIMAYTVFFGFVGSFTVVSFQRGVTQRQVWLLFLVPICLDIFQQEALLHYQLLMYYGNQPLVLLWKFPFWWAPCDSFGDILAATVFFRLMPHMKGGKALLLPLIYPLADFVGYAAVAVPGFYAVNSEWPNWVIQLCGLASWVLVIPLVRAIARSVATDSPTDA
jgi:hypothetical protein